MVDRQGRARRVRQAIEVIGLLARNPSQVRQLRQLVPTIGKPPLQTRLPWLAFDVIDWLKANTTRESRVFEFGGGGSTAWFADHAGHVTTVESDPEWAAGLAAAVGESTRVDILTASDADNYAAYVSMIDQYPDGSFDLVVVDGRQRVRCLQRAMPKVKSGGAIMLDDSERAKYASAADILAAWHRVDFRGLAPGKTSLGHTTVWTKP